MVKKILCIAILGFTSVLLFSTDFQISTGYSSDFKAITFGEPYGIISSGVNVNRGLDGGVGVSIFLGIGSKLEIGEKILYYYYLGPAIKTIHLKLGSSNTTETSLGFAFKSIFQYPITQYITLNTPLTIGYKSAYKTNNEQQIWCEVGLNLGFKI